MKNPVIILTGPTAVGKTELSLRLAKQINGAIISADSMQVYRHMDIGSAKIMPNEMQGIPHYLVDCIEPDEEFNVTVFQRMAKQALHQIYENGQIPIVVGGTGFYVQALLYDIAFTEHPTETAYRKELEEQAKIQGIESLHDRLKQVDPKSAELIHANNVKRVIRALEYYHETGEPISIHNEREHKRQSPYQSAYYVLTDEREHLYERINARVDHMMEQGLVTEVQRLKDSGYHRGMVSMQGLGYKEILAYLENEISLEEAVYRIKRDTRHFAKRQLTWFRREQDVCWIDKQTFSYDETAILSYLIKDLKEKKIICN